jgi:hypothetical protein
MRSKSILAFLATVILAGGMCASVPTHAADSKHDKELKATDIGSASKAISGKDANVKTEEPKGDDPKAKSENPREGKRQAAAAAIRVENNTPWHLHVYVNGDYEGTLSPWSYVDIPFTTGKVTVYARVNFDNGTYVPYGPHTIYLNAGDVYTWNCGSN